MTNRVPGRLLDLQVNGYLGIDFSSPTLTSDAAKEACDKMIAHGVEMFLPTIVTSREEIYRRNLPLLAELTATPELEPHIPGIHAEGPFLSSRPGPVGAHNPDWIVPPSTDQFDRMQEWADGRIAILTIAADQPGAAELAAHVSRSGVAVFLGHHDATYDDLRRLADAGASALTHLGNGMANSVNRHRNALIAGLAVDELSATIITDGHHLPDHLIKVIVGVKGPDKVAVISDASALAGMPPGEYQLPGNRVRIEESGLLHNPDKQCLVGSSVTMVECAGHIEALGITTDDELSRMVWDNPQRLIGG